MTKDKIVLHQYYIHFQFSTYFNKFLTYLFEMQVVLWFFFNIVDHYKIHVK
jgi:hypothetical protein